MLTNKQWDIFYQLQELRKQGKENTEEFNQLADKLWESLDEREPERAKRKHKTK